MTQREIDLTATFSAIIDLNERRLAFLKETVEFYNLKNRATNSAGGCLYHATKSSPGCAIGRFLPDDGKFNINVKCGIESAIKIGNRVPDWMMEMGRDFLTDVQLLHDIEFYWTDSGISEMGKIKMNEIINAHIAQQA